MGWLYAFLLLYYLRYPLTLFDTCPGPHKPKTRTGETREEDGIISYMSVSSRWETYFICMSHPKLQKLTELCVCWLNSFELKQLSCSLTSKTILQTHNFAPRDCHHIRLWQFGREWYWSPLFALALAFAVTKRVVQTSFYIKWADNGL